MTLRYRQSSFHQVAAWTGEAIGKMKPIIGRKSPTKSMATKPRLVDFLTCLTIPCLKWDICGAENGSLIIISIRENGWLMKGALVTHTATLRYTTNDQPISSVADYLHGVVGTAESIASIT